MKPDEFRDMQILHEVQQNPSITQRDLGKKIGLALGLTNLRLHRLCTEGCINIVEASKNRISYVVTPKGGQEKERLIAEYFDASMGYYRDVRQFLKQRLLVLAEQQVRRILLYGTGEIAEAAYLTIQEVGLDLVAVVGEASQRQSFFNLPIRDISDLETLEFDRVIIAAFESGAPNGHQGLSRIPKEKVIRLPENPTSLPRPSLRGWFSSASAVSWAARPPATDVVILCGGQGTRLRE